MKVPAAAAALCACLSQTACSDNAAPSSVVGRDSAGIVIVESKAPLWNTETHWRLSRDPVLTIGAGAKNSGPDYQLSYVWGLARLSDGTIVAADLPTNQIKYFDSTGKFVRSVGRPGTGPGEVRQLVGLKRMTGDSVAAQDAPFALLVHDRNGKYGRSIRMSDSLVNLQNMAGFMPDGSFLAWDLPAPASAPQSKDPVADSVRLYHLASDGTVIGLVGQFPGWLRLNDGSERTNVFMYGPLGWFATDSTRVIAAFPRTFELRMYKLDGSLQRIIRRSFEPVAVTPNHVELMRKGFLGLTGFGGVQITEEQHRRWNERVARSPISATMPAHSIFRVDVGGNLWVNHYDLAPTTYGLGVLPESPDSLGVSVFNPEGQWLGDLKLPPSFSLQDVGNDYVLGVGTDSTGAEFIAMYALFKGRQ